MWQSASVLALVAFSFLLLGVAPASSQTKVEVVRTSGLTAHGQVVKHLKVERGLTHGYANLIAHKAKEDVEASPASGDDELESW